MEWRSSIRRNPLRTNAVALLRRHESRGSADNGSTKSTNDKKESSSKDDSTSNKDEKHQDDNPEANRRAWKMVLAAWGVYFGILLYSLPGTKVDPCTLEDFLNVLLPSGEVQEITIRLPFNYALIRLHPGAVIGGIKTSEHVQATFLMTLPPGEHAGDAVRRFEAALEVRERSLGIAAHQRVPIKLQFTCMAAAILLTIYASLRGRIKDSMRKANFKLVDSTTPTSSRPKAKFADVIGLHEAKVEVMEFVDYMKTPDKYTKLGAKLPKGAIMLGPPGCGKTLLAKAVAGEAKVPFMASAGSDFVEMIGGLGAARVRSLFKEAKQRAPCIIYIDEIDALGRRRSGGSGNFGGMANSEMEQTLNQLLVEMDGMESDKGVIVLASTNRPDILDKALLRPGRFDRHITIDLPTLIERRQLFDYYLGKIKLEKKPSVYSARLAQLTPGFSGADVANVVNEAAIHAASNAAADMVTAADLDAAMERVVAGSRKRSDTVSPEERKIVAWHEAGHALTAWLVQHADALIKVTIIPRTSAALGFAQYAPTERRLLAKNEVTQVAYDQVKVYGMNDVVGPLSFGSSGEQKEADFQKKPYSKKLHAVMDSEASKLIGEAYRHTEKLLRENQTLLDKLANALLKRETLNYDDVRAILGIDPVGGAGKKVVELADAADILPPPASRNDSSS